MGHDSLQPSCCNPISSTETNPQTDGSLWPTLPKNSWCKNSQSHGGDWL